MKLLSIIDLFRKGVSVSQPGLFKDAANATTVLAPALVAAAKLAGDFGWIAVQLDLATATAIAGGIATFVHWVVLNISSQHAGILPAKPVPEPEPVAPTVRRVRAIGAPKDQEVSGG